MKIESKKVSVPQTAKSVFEKMEKIENFQALMPENLQKFTLLAEDSFAFALQGMPEISLKKKEVIPYSELRLGALEGKIPFELTLSLKEIDANQTEAQFFFEGEFNPMMAMLVKSPITKLLETMAERLVYILKK